MWLTRYKPLRQFGAVLETANWLALKLWLKRVDGVNTFPSRIFRNYMALARSGRWHSRDIFDIVPIPPGTRIELEHIPGGGISTSVDELAYLALLTRAIGPSAVFEIGTFRGRTALNFALNSPEACIVHTLDLPESDRSLDHLNVADRAIVAASRTGADYFGKDVSHKIRQHRGNSQTFDFSPFYGAVDLVFVDGAHHYAAARHDTLEAIKMVRPGGLIIWHDFANYGDYNDVTRAILDELPGDQIIQIASSELAVFRAPSVIGTTAQSSALSAEP